MPADVPLSELSGIVLTARNVQGDEVFVTAGDLDCVLSNHADCLDILNLIARTSPQRVIFVHGSPTEGGPRNIIDETRERFGSLVDIHHSVNGAEIEI